MSGPDGAGGTEPPPIPPDAPAAAAPAKSGLSTKAIVLIVCGVLAIPCLAGVVTTVAIMVPRMQETARKTTCMSNLSELSHVYISQTFQDRKVAQRWSGSSLWLAMRRDLKEVLPGQEAALLCPGDHDVVIPAAGSDVSAWDEVDLEHPPRALCSYAGRDFAAFPIDPDDEQSHPIGACVHHRGGAVVAFDDKDAVFMTREELGLEREDEIRVGPESKSEILRVLRGGE